MSVFYCDNVLCLEKIVDITVLEIIISLCEETIRDFKRNLRCTQITSVHLAYVLHCIFQMKDNCTRNRGIRLSFVNICYLPIHLAGYLNPMVGELK